MKVLDKLFSPLLDLVAMLLTPLLILEIIVTLGTAFVLHGISPRVADLLGRWFKRNGMQKW